jgi:hypothetical protein
MNIKRQMISNIGTVIIFLVVSFVLAALFSGMLIHEGAHAIMAIAFGLRIYSWDLTHVTYETSSNPIVNTIIGLAGGTAQALSSLLLLWLIVRIENLYVQKPLNRWRFLGIKSGVLTVVFNGVITAIWEGFFYESYIQTYNNQLLEGTIWILSSVVALCFFYKQKPFDRPIV